MRSQLKNILIIGVYFFLQTVLILITAQTVNLDGAIVTIDDIPINRHLNIVEDSGLKSSRPGTKEHPIVFKSNNGKFFAKATNVEVTNQEMLKSSTGLDKVVSKFELFTDQGNKLYSIDLEHKVLRARLSNDGKYAYVMINNFRPDLEIDYTELKILDPNGNELKALTGVGDFVTNNHDGVFYLKYEKDNDRVCFFGFYGLEPKNTWELQIDRGSTISAISQDGSHIILTSTKYPGLQSYNSSGVLLWNNPEFPGGSWASALSSNGNYLLRMEGGDKYIVFDNLSGDFLSSIRPFEINGELVRFRTGCFIDNSEDRILISSMVRINGEVKTVLSEHNIGGELIRKTFVKSRIRGYRLGAVFNNDSTISVFLDGLLDVLLNNEKSTPPTKYMD